MNLPLCLRFWFCVGIWLCASAGPALSQPPVVAVPFQFLRQEVVVSVWIGGRGPYTALLDTGTDPSIIDLALARTLGLKLDAQGGPGEGGGTEKNLAYGTELPMVRVGGLTASHVDTLAMDLSGVSRKFGRRLDAVLGESLLRDRIVQFDYPHRVVRFLARAPQAAAHQVVLPFTGETEVILGHVRINGRPVPASLDTGSNDTFQITPHTVARLGLSASATHARMKSEAGFNGAFHSRVGTVPRITLGTLVVPHPRVTFWLPGTGRDHEAWGVNIGNVFLQDFIVTIDYPHKIVTFEKTPD